MRSLTLLSLPSRLVFLFAACQIPVLVVGGGNSCAAQIVDELKIGLSCPYEAEAFRAAVAHLSEPRFNLQCAGRCRMASELFRSDGLDSWIWKSGNCGSPCDGRFDFLEAFKLRSGR